MLLRRSRRIRDELARARRQPAAVAELGQRALAGLELEALLDEAVVAVASELGTDFVSVLELTGDRRGLLVRAGHGFPEGVLGGVLPVAREQVQGHALHADGPVVV